MSFDQQSSAQLQSQVVPGSVALGPGFNLLDDNDEEYRAFRERKMTIMSNVTHLVKKKYA